jgi:hypothetical protein
MAEPTATFKAIEHTADLGVEITAKFCCARRTSGEALFGLIFETMDVALPGWRASFLRAGEFTEG